MRWSRSVLFLAMSFAVFVAPLAQVFSEPPSARDLRSAMQKSMKDGNFKDAYDGFRRLALNPLTDPRRVAGDLNQALGCLGRLGRVNEIDAFREAVAEVHRGNWRLLWAVGQSYMSYAHYGYMIAGEFQRGQHRGGGQVVNVAERDRTRALQLMQEAMPLLKGATAKGEVSQFYRSLAGMLLNNRGYAASWRLQYLTDLAVLPDYEPGWPYGRGQALGAPVDEAGKPVFHTTPKSWEAAETDGQRWRFALAQAVEWSPGQRNEIRYEFANFLQHQFGTQTMAHYGGFFYRQTIEDGQQDQSGTYALHTLAENETIARLATGIKRFDLPDEFNFIKIYQQIAADDKAGYGERATGQLARIFENRRQYPKAAQLWRESIEKYGDREGRKRKRLEQITGNWGRFEPVMTQPAGQGASVEFRFRNGKRVALSAHTINVKKLLADVKAYLKSNPRQLDWQHVNIGSIGHRLVTQNQTKYVGRRVAQWKLELAPRAGHFDKRITIATPLQKAGAYLLTAKMADGNISKIVVWLADTAIIKKPMAGGAYYFVADAVTGQPIVRANVEFFGYWQERVGKERPRRYRVRTRNFAEFTDADGQVFQTAGKTNRRYQWIVTATTGQGRLAYLGFTRVWHAAYPDRAYNRVKVFTITDRPVYRPSDTVKFKFWVRRAQYDREDTSQFARRTFDIRIRDPKGDEVLKKYVVADEYGGIDGEFELPADAALGVYQLQVSAYGGGTFRVEEYKKPEFEVTVDAPTEPVMLGEKITATIRAKYYFGSPVTHAKVKYKVLRTNYTQQWYPAGRWDWLYGRGYWWYAYDYRWYPGWGEWGCGRPWPWWFPVRQTPPEVVAEREVEIGEDGTVEVEIDTEAAKLIHPDQDHSYRITAEVVDQSRRTIVGTGTVLVARKPFKVFAWVDRGYYRVGDTIRASFSARTLDNKPVKGDGKVTLLAIRYNQKNEPVETVAGEWDLSTDAEGSAGLQIKATAQGQYRLRYQVTDAAEHTIEGGYVFTIVGEGFDGSEFRFNDLELVTDSREYQPGEKVRLQINTNRVGSTVLLFVRPSGGVYLPPKIVRLHGKSTMVEVAVVKKDMPNFFIEAATVAGGRVHTLAREVYVPPEKRVLGVEVVASSETYKPGEKAKVTLKLTDHEGRPFIGSAVLAIYDKSVEYISGGSNVGAIKEFFWKWRRSHHIQTETNLQRYFGNLTLPGKPGMANLGVFGGSVPEEQGQQAMLREGVAGGMPRRAMPSALPFSSRGRRLMKGAKSLDDSNSSLILSGTVAASEIADNLESRERFGQDGSPLVEPTVRTKFADTALWNGSLVTGSDGLAEVELDMPENLTTWKVRTWAMGHGTRVGEGQTQIVTRKDLIVRMQAPRFFVERDEVVLSANVHNYLATAKRVEVDLELAGETLEALGDPVRTVEVAENGEARVDWRVKVVGEGQAVVRMKALTDEESDAVEMTFPVYVHGMLKTESFSAALRPDEERGAFTIRVPSERRPDQSRLEVRYSPTLAGAMVDALPYLIDYPYGCTEQTLNRFLPAVITQKVLIDMGLDLAAIREKRTNLNAQEIGDDRQRAEGWKRYRRNPVFNEAELTSVVKAGVERLTQMQLSDGGWGWFSGWGEHSSAHTTAVVVHGLQIARQNDVALVPGVLGRGVSWLTRYQNEQVRRLQNAATKTKPYKTRADNLDALVSMVLVDAGVRNPAMMDYLYRDRNQLAVYGKATFGLALHKLGEREKLAMILRNIEQFVVQDEENQTAYLNLPGGEWWYWYGSEYEAHAYYLKLLVATDPQSRTASRLVKYLLNNRKHATRWNSTRDTALAVEALADYLRASGEDKPDMTVEVWLDGKQRKEVKITTKDLFTFDNKFVLAGEAVTSGVHTVELRKRGKGPLYFNAYLTNFTLEDPIARAGLELKVRRKYYKLVPVDKQIKVAGSRGQAVEAKVEKYDRVELVNLATLKSGDLVEIELEIESKNDYEYLIVEDMKAAGFEPVEVRSGYSTNGLGAYMELRDNRVTFFVRQLARGRHSVAYRMRAEIPGRFSALPTWARAMYAPELKGNSDEIKFTIVD